MISHMASGEFGAIYPSFEDFGKIWLDAARFIGVRPGSTDFRGDLAISAMMCENPTSPGNIGIGRAIFGMVWPISSLLRQVVTHSTSFGTIWRYLAKFGKT